MVGMETQKPVYWEKFSVEEHDIEHLYGLLLDEASPLSTDELILALVKGRCEREERLIEERLGKGCLFQPKGSYEVGEQLIFPVLDYALGTVVSIRPGHNPAYEPFKVIRVRFEGKRKEREFASELEASHALNRKGGGAGLVSPKELCVCYGEVIQAKLVERLRGSRDFINFGGQWFLEGLLADVHVGHLNIAEAAIETAGVPLSSERLLEELDIPTEMKEAALIFSLNYTLAHDERFDEVGAEGRALWFLHRLEPPEAIEQPPFLRYQPEPYDRSVLDEEMLQLEQEIDDEATELVATEEPTFSVTMVLTYPHRRAGTIPLTAKTRGLFPRRGAQRTYIVLIDGHTGKRMPGWMVREHNYVCGLGEWYEEHNIPVGAYIDLERTEDPLEVRVGYTPRPRRREWVRVARASEGRLAFEMQMRTVACDYDELMIVSQEDPAELDALWRKVEEEGSPLYQLMCEVFPELAKLNPQGTVHIKTLYSAINVERRCPPGPILAELASRPCFIPIGDGYWVYDENLRE
ncbi:MAG: hypothetical protein U9R11_00290 [Chloroflexota bacterium]|nr:hypothetical protein [Chloroflexota bacterium]